MQNEPVKPLDIDDDNVSLKTALQSRLPGFQTMLSTAIDTIPLVEFVKIKNFDRQPALYLNGKFMSNFILSTIDPTVIDNIHIEKNDIEIEKKRYYGQIYINFKKEYTPKIISLTDLILKYTNLKNEFTIFMLDYNIIKEDCDQFFVDEKYILKILIDTIEVGNDNQNINVIQLLTKSKENIEKASRIFIRGLNEMALD